MSGGRRKSREILWIDFRCERGGVATQGTSRESGSTEG
jgi:hypothetical protein